MLMMLSFKTSFLEDLGGAEAKLLIFELEQKRVEKMTKERLYEMLSV
jgi:hypothetical protein